MSEVTDHIKFYLSKADEVGHASDRQVSEVTDHVKFYPGARQTRQAMSQTDR